MCVLRVDGSKFDPRAFLERSAIQAYEVWREGEPRRAGPKRLGPVHDSAGFKVDVSQKEWTNLAGQVEDAIAFLEQYREDLQVLTRTPSVAQVWLDFPFATPDTGEPPFLQSVFLPPRLLSLAGGLGVAVEVSIYPPVSDEAG
jgi:hypothetical protein